MDEELEKKYRQIKEEVDTLKKEFNNHLSEHAKLVALIETIATNTSELVTIIKGAKGLRSFVVWIAPVVGALYAAYHWLLGK